MKVSKANAFVRGLIYSLLGIGVAGNGFYTYQNNQNQTQAIGSITQELDQSKGTILELRERLHNEQSTNQFQARQMSELTQNLEQERNTNQNQTNQLREHSSREQQLRTQLSSLNNDLRARITLDQFASAISSVTPSTVKVEGIDGWGSGVIMIGENGGRYILTNGHVTEGNDIAGNEFEDGVYHIRVYNGTDYNNPIEFDAAPVILSNGHRAHSAPGEHDLSLLAIPPDVKLPPNVGIRMRDIGTHPLRVGEPVFAIGNPFDKTDTVTIGSISHIDRSSTLNRNHHIQTDAAINPGNSGGGLFSIRIVNGRPTVELIGINTWIVRGGNNLGGSIRVDEIQKVFNSWGIRL